jgi:hypothetical protein
MLIADSYCEVLHISRQAFSVLMRQFPVLDEVLKDANESRHKHGVFIMGSASSVGDWIRPRSHYQNLKDSDDVAPMNAFRRSATRKVVMEAEKADSAKVPFRRAATRKMVMEAGKVDSARKLRTSKTWLDSDKMHQVSAGA